MFSDIFSEKKEEDVNQKNETSWIWANRLHTKGTGLRFEIIKAIITFESTTPRKVGQTLYWSIYKSHICTYI